MMCSMGIILNISSKTRPLSEVQRLFKGERISRIRESKVSRYTVNVQIIYKKDSFTWYWWSRNEPSCRAYAQSGYIVTGSDRYHSAAALNLEKTGIKVQYSHIPDLINDADLVVYSSAVREDNPERVYAMERGIRTMRRAEFLGEIMRMYFTVCISGTHGKTTTTSMVGIS